MPKAKVSNSTRQKEKWKMPSWFKGRARKQEIITLKWLLNNMKNGLKTQLLNNLPFNSIEAVKNALYYKQILLTWLREVIFHPLKQCSSLKFVIYVEKNKSHYEHYFDEILEKEGHKILRPPYHPELNPNPIELIWTK